MTLSTKVYKMKRLSLSNIVTVCVVILLTLLVYHGIKSLSLTQDRALVTVQLVSVKPHSSKTYDENGFFVGTFVGEFTYQGHQFEYPVSISERFELLKNRKPVNHMKMLSAADIGLSTPFWGPVANVLFLAAFLLNIVISACVWVNGSGQKSHPTAV